MIKLTQRTFLILLFAVITLSLILNLGQAYSLWNMADAVLIGSRWLTMALLVVYALRKKSLTTWILISMVLGVEFGYDAPTIAIHLNVLSKIFLNLVKTIIAPLLFGTLVVGIAGHSNLKQIGRMGWKSIVYFEIVSTIALFIGLFAINISKAGVGVNIPGAIDQSGLHAAKPQTAEEIILHVFPENIAKAVYDGQVLQIVIFSILFGIAVAMLKEVHRNRMVHFAESLSEVMFKFTNLVMYFAPIAVFAAISYSVGNMGIGILGNLIQLLATLYVSLIIFLAGVLLPIALLMKIPVRNFIRAVSEPATIAFATTSSESALPIAMETMEKFGVPRKIVAFVMPTGYSFNLDGTTLYLSLATIFVAQVAGIH
ncbi:MAG TPA: cation:dicarboxylase symporter family transporter, partial [Bacteroidales bacterium]|nr:cation:dicarboxylase symporter family transporter [Bacteroidales bacterium]